MKLLITILFFVPLFINAQSKVFAVNRPSVYPDPPADTTPLPQGRQHLLFESTFDEVNPFNKYYELTAASCCAYSIALKTDTVYRGTHAVRFILFDTDPTFGSGGTRSELTPRWGETQPNVERWVGFAAYMPVPGYDPDTDPQGEDLFNQSHSANGESPSFGIYTLQGRIRIGHNYGTSGSPEYHTDETGYNYIQNQWVRWVYHVKFASDGTGFITVWMNDVQIFTYSGVTQYSDVTGGNFWRIGIYKWPWSQSLGSSVHFREILYDDYRIGDQNATYSDVVPRSSD